MRGARGRVSDRVIGIALGIILGIAVVVIAFLILGSRSTIDAPLARGQRHARHRRRGTQDPAGALRSGAQAEGATVGFSTDEIGNAHSA